MVECSPATRAARVRFPDDANCFENILVRLFIESEIFLDSEVQHVLSFFMSPLKSKEKDMTYHQINERYLISKQFQ